MVIMQIIKRSFVAYMLLHMIYLNNVYAQTAPSANEHAAYKGLFSASHEGDVETTLELVKNAAALEERDGSGRTPLIIAAFASHDAIVKILAEAGADLNAMDYRAYDIVTIASVANDIDMLDLALSLGTSASNITSPYDGTALIAAAHLGHHVVVDRLIKANAPLDHVNNLNWTALIEAVVLGDGGPNHTQTVELLLKAGADQSITDGQGVLPLEHAKARGYQHMIQFFDNEIQ